MRMRPADDRNDRGEIGGASEAGGAGEIRGDEPLVERGGVAASPPATAAGDRPDPPGYAQEDTVIVRGTGDGPQSEPRRD